MPRYRHEIVLVNIWRSEYIMNGFPDTNFSFQITKRFENCINKLHSTNYLQLTSRVDVVVFL